MRVRVRHLVLLTLALALTAAVPAAPAAKHRPLASAKVVQCVNGAVPATRFAIFRAAARKVAHTDRMWIRFKLQERTGGGRFRTVEAPGLGVWRKSRSGVKRYAIRQRVLALEEGGSYRVAVQFRWYDSEGERLHSARRFSKTCKQPGLLPNLRVTRIGGRKVNGTFRYAVDVSNRGLGASSPTSLALRVDGDTVDTPALGALAAGQTRRVFVNGPTCTGSVRAVADPSDAVRETNELDNARTAACPL